MSFGYFIDIVICIDVSSDMHPMLSTLKENALSFFGGLEAAFDSMNSSFDRARVKVVAFRDFDGLENPIKESGFFLLPEEAEDFSAFLNGLSAEGGADAPECALEALSVALGSDWTTEGTKRRHVVLMLSDAGAHPLGYRAKEAKYPEGMPRDLDGLRARWEGTDPDFVSTYQRNAGRLIAFVPDEEPWGEVTEWERCWVLKCESFMGLYEVDMATIYDIISASM